MWHGFRSCFRVMTYLAMVVLLHELRWHFYGILFGVGDSFFFFCLFNCLAQWAYTSVSCSLELLLIRFTYLWLWHLGHWALGPSLFLFNIVDNRTVNCWKKTWGTICKFLYEKIQLKIEEFWLLKYFWDQKAVGKSFICCTMPMWRLQLFLWEDTK